MSSAPRLQLGARKRKAMLLGVTTVYVNNSTAGIQSERMVARENSMYFEGTSVNIILGEAKEVRNA